MKFALLMPQDIIDIKPLNKRLLLVGGQDVYEIHVGKRLTARHVFRHKNLKAISVDYRKPYIAVGAATGVFLVSEDSNGKRRYAAVYTGRDTYPLFGRFKYGNEIRDIVFIMREYKKASFGGAVEVAYLSLNEIISGKRKGVFSGEPFFFESPFIGFCEKSFLPSALSRIAVADVDKDLLDELVLISSCPSGWTVLIIKGNENISGFLLPEDVLYPISIQKYDFDNDGQEEIVVFSESDEYIIVTFAKIITADEAIVSSVHVDKSKLTFADRYWGSFLDTNGDGLPEILILAEKLPEEGKIMSSVEAFSIYADGSVHKVGKFNTLPISRVLVYDVDADGSEEILLQTFGGINIVKIVEKSKLNIAQRFFFPSYLRRIHAFDDKNMVLIGSVLKAEKEGLFGIYLLSDGFLEFLGMSTIEPISKKISDRVAIAYNDGKMWNLIGLKNNELIIDVSTQLGGTISDVIFICDREQKEFLAVVDDNKVLRISPNKKETIYVVGENEKIMGVTQLDIPIAVILSLGNKKPQLKLINLVTKKKITEVDISPDEVQSLSPRCIVQYTKENEIQIAILMKSRIVFISKFGNIQSMNAVIGNVHYVMAFDFDQDNVDEFCIISSVGAFILDTDGKVLRLKRKPRAIDFVEENGKIYALTSIAVDVLKLEMNELLMY